jgi:membrane-associated protease RseP (regulator of RpoE activity)
MIRPDEPSNPDDTTTASDASVSLLEHDRLIDLTVFEKRASAPSPVPPSTRVHPLVSLLAVGTLLALAVSAGKLLTLAVVAALAGMIFFHELGHFLAARLTNTKATEFFVGFGPRLWSFRRGETEYGVKAIPLGGYVKILGMNNLDAGVAPEDESRTYRQATFPRRVLMASAGTMMHLLLAFVLFMVTFAGTGRLDSSKVVSVQPGSPAASAGMLTGDEIVSVNGLPARSWDAFRTMVGTYGAKPMAIEVLRSGKTVTVAVTAKDAGSRYLIGVETKTAIFRDSLPAAASRSVGHIGQLVPQTFVSLGHFFAPGNLTTYAKNLVDPPQSAVEKDNAQNNRMLSPVGATNLLGDAARSNIRYFLEIFASINVFVGIFNMLPILPLDGGHVLIATYERFRSRPKRGMRYRVDVRHWLPVTYAVMAVMLLLSVSSLYLDVRNPIKIF